MRHFFVLPKLVNGSEHALRRPSDLINVWLAIYEVEKLDLMAIVKECLLLGCIRFGSSVTLCNLHATKIVDLWENVVYTARERWSQLRKHLPATSNHSANLTSSCS
jgi:hypothetical protein